MSRYEVCNEVVIKGVSQQKIDQISEAHLDLVLVIFFLIFQEE